MAIPSVVSKMPSTNKIGLRLSNAVAPEPIARPIALPRVTGRGQSKGVFALIDGAATKGTVQGKGGDCHIQHGAVIGTHLIDASHDT